jgi:hypothetical protein
MLCHILQALIGYARKEAQQHPSSSSSSGSLSIVNAEVRQLLQPHEEGLLLRPHPSRATTHMEMVIPQGPPMRPCANCQHEFHILRRCKACQSVEYCGRDCQVRGHDARAAVLCDLRFGCGFNASVSHS